MKFKTLLLSALLATGFAQASEKENTHLTGLSVEIIEYNEILRKIEIQFSEKEIEFIQDLSEVDYLAHINDGKPLENYISMKPTKNGLNNIVEFKLDGCYSKNTIDLEINKTQILSVCRGTKTIKLTKS